MKRIRASLASQLNAVPGRLRPSLSSSQSAAS